MAQRKSSRQGLQREDKLSLGQGGLETELNSCSNTVVQFFLHEGWGWGHYADPGWRDVKGTERGSRVIRCQVRKNGQQPSSRFTNGQFAELKGAISELEIHQTDVEVHRLPWERPPVELKKKKLSSNSTSQAIHCHSSFLKKRSPWPMMWCK